MRPDLSNGGITDLLTEFYLMHLAPAIGVIRRHPDIKLLRRNADDKLAIQQLAMLTALWPLPSLVDYYCTLPVRYYRKKMSR